MAPSNYRMLESAWRIHVQPAWGTTRIADIELNGVEQWIGRMGQICATTVLRSFGVLAGILDDAVKSRRLASNPARGAENLPHKTGKRRVYLSPDDVGRLAAESGSTAPGVDAGLHRHQVGRSRRTAGVRSAVSPPPVERARQRGAVGC